MSQKIIKKKKHQTLHPFELAFCGYRNTGKTTLIAALTRLLAPDFKVGYLKHDAHHFEMDHPGKDTDILSRSGARQVMITSADKKALLGSEPVGFFERQRHFEACDLLLIEGYKHQPTPKIILLDAMGDILKPIQAGEVENILAFVGALPVEQAPNDLGAPYFQRDDLPGIYHLILDYVKKINQSTPLFGLVLAGGRSTRMQQDKALLRYRDKPQLEVAYDLLTPHCQQVFISSRPAQWQDSTLKQTAISTLPQIHDRFLDFGPMGGILTAMTEYPEAAWLVLACDLPLLDNLTLEYLLQNRNPHKLASAYLSSSDGLPEPLCAVYEPRMRSRLLAFLGAGYACPRKALLNSEIKTLNLPQPRALDNANTPDDYQGIKAALTETHHV